MSALQRFQVTCPNCEGYATKPHHSRPTAFWEKDFHDSFIHGGDDTAEVQEVASE
ncbi:MAG: hypothetical protein ACOCQ3_05505 [Natronomonas sp.]